MESRCRIHRKKPQPSIASQTVRYVWTKNGTSGGCLPTNNIIVGIVIISSLPKCCCVVWSTAVTYIFKYTCMWLYQCSRIKVWSVQFVFSRFRPSTKVKVSLGRDSRSKFKNTFETLILPGRCFFNSVLVVGLFCFRISFMKQSIPWHINGVGRGCFATLFGAHISNALSLAISMTCCHSDFEEHKRWWQKKR